MIMVVKTPGSQMGSSAAWNLKKKTFQKVRLAQKGPTSNVLIRDKISFVGVAHLTRGGGSCSWALYRLTIHI